MPRLSGVAKALVIVRCLIRPVLALGAVLGSATSWAQNPEPPPAHYPRLIYRGADAQAFVPPGWVLESSKFGDVDGDGRPDLVMVLHQHDPKNVIAQPDGGENPMDANPRILAIAVGEPDTRSFRLVVENHSLIPRHDDAFVFDEFADDRGDLHIAHGAFEVSLDFEANAGSWTQSSRSLTFRLVGGRCLLIGFDNDARDRRDGSTIHTSVNYLTHRWFVEKAAGDDAPTRTRRGRTPAGPLKTIEQVGDGMIFEPAVGS